MNYISILINCLIKKYINLHYYNRQKQIIMLQIKIKLQPLKETKKDNYYFKSNLYNFHLFIICREMERVQQPLDQNRKRLVVECLKNLISKSTQRKQELSKALNQFQKSPYMTKLQENLNDHQLTKQALRTLIMEYNSWKKCYGDLIKQNKYPNIIPVPNIDEFLLSFQSKVKFDMQQFQRQISMSGRYNTSELTYTVEINKVRVQYNWSKEFIGQWRQRKKQYLNDLWTKSQIKRQTQIKKQQKVKEEEKKKNQQKQKEQREKLAKEKQKEKSKQKLQINQPATLQKIKKAKIQQYSQDISQSYSQKKNILKKRQVKEKQLPAVATNITNDNLKQQSGRINEDKSNYSQQKKIRLNNIHHYLEGRKDLPIKQNEFKKFAEFININFEDFMKMFLKKVIYAAKLRNQNYQKMDAGNQFKIFSKQNNNIKCQIPVQKPAAMKIYKLKYPQKLEIYTMMRIKEEEKQQEIRNQFMQCKGEKKRETKLLDQLLRPRQIFTQRWAPKDQSTSERLVISNNHVQLVLQEHPRFKNGIAMFKSYHY